MPSSLGTGVTVVWLSLHDIVLPNFLTSFVIKLAHNNFSLFFKSLTHL